MKMKKGLLMVVALLAMASLMAAMAFSSATINNKFSLSVKNSNEALLALTPSEYHDAAYLESNAASPLAKVLKIDLNNGYNGGDFGVQPDSTYVWNDLFKTTNNSEHSVDVTISLDPKQFNSGAGYDNGTPMDITLQASYDGATWVTLATKNVNNAKELKFELAPNTNQWVDIKVITTKGWAEPFNFNLLVGAVSK